MTMSLILFDLDNTLLDTGAAVNQGFKPAIQAFLGVEETDFNDANQTYWSDLADSTDFDPQLYAAFLAERYGRPAAGILEIIYQPRWFQNNVFSDVTMLDDLKQDYDLGVFSQGNRAYQLHKLKVSNLERLFSPDLVYIFKRKLDPQVLVSLPEAVVVDDRLGMVLGLKDSAQITPIWLNRSQQQTEEKILQIQSLFDLPSLLPAS